MAHQPHRPRRIVVRAEIRIGIHLLLEQDFREPAVRLIALDDERTGGERGILQFHFGDRAADFDALHAQEIDETLNTRHVALTGRNHVARDRFLASGLDRDSADRELK